MSAQLCKKLSITKNRSLKEWDYQIIMEPVLKEILMDQELQLQWTNLNTEIITGIFRIYYLIKLNYLKICMDHVKWEIKNMIFAQLIKVYSF